MATTPEGRVKTKIKKTLDRLGVKHWSPMTHGYGRSGVHDIHGLYKGHLLSIEAKKDAKSPPTALQIKEAVSMIENGASVLLIHKDNLEKLEETIDLIDSHVKVNNSPLLQSVVWPEELLTYG